MTIAPEPPQIDRPAEPSPRRDWRTFLLAVALLAASASIVTGVALWDAGAAFVAAGILFAAWAYVVIAE